MTKLRNYEVWKLRKLSNPIFAAHYLNEVEKSSPELVLSAIQNVVRAREVRAVAQEAGVARENIYRAFSEEGNPTFTTFRDVLKAVGVKFHFEPLEELPSPMSAHPLPETGLSSLHSEQRAASLLASLEEETPGPRLAYVNPNPPQFLTGIGQQKKPLRSAHGQHQDSIWEPAIR